MNKRRKVALDPGFGGFKVAETDPDHDGLSKIPIINLPAVVGTGETEMGLLGLAGVTGRRRRTVPYTVKIEETTMLVGPNVADYGRPIERLDFGRLKNGPEMRALTYTALGLHLGAGESTLSLVVGLPVEILQGPEGKPTLRGLRKWLRGRHSFSVDHAFYVLEIQDIKAAAQPLGAYLEWGLDDYGNWHRSKADLVAPVAILDIGFNTVDLFTVRGGEITRRYTSGRSLGMRRVAQAVSNLLNTTYQRELSMTEADELVRQYVTTRGRYVTLDIPGGRADVADTVEAALELAAGEVIAFVEAQWGNGSQFSYILLTGGGILAMGPYLTDLYGHAEVLPNPDTANARGLAKLANRAGFLK